MSNKCEYCGKQFENNYFDQPIFCDKECLDQYCEEYLQENWKEWASLMGVHFRE